MLIRIINRNSKEQLVVRAEIVDFDQENWLITTNGEVQMFPRRNYEVILFA